MAIQKSFLYLHFFLFLVSCSKISQDSQENAAKDTIKSFIAPQKDSLIQISTDTAKVNPINNPTEKGDKTALKNTPIPKKAKPQIENKTTIPPATPAPTTEEPHFSRPIPPPAPPLKSNIPPVTPLPPKVDKPFSAPPKAQSAETDVSSDKKAPLSHQLWDELLRKHVATTGKVNYKGFIEDKEKLSEYLSVLNQNPAQPDWNSNKQMAYWINAYNAFTIKLIIDKYPVTSINNVGAKPWDIPFINLGIKKYSLNQIENEILRPQFKEPRIHFALNCAAKSCPKLLNEAFLPEKLEAQLAKQTKDFVNSQSANNLTEKKIEISPIFDWYKADFQEGIISFLNKYANVKIQDNAKISFKEYDWNLNE